MPLFALTPELVASIKAQYPSLATLNLSGNGARGAGRFGVARESLTTWNMIS